MPHACVMPVGTLWYLVDVVAMCICCCDARLFLAVAENLPNFVCFRLDKDSVLLVLGVNEFEWFAC